MKQVHLLQNHNEVKMHSGDSISVYCFFVFYKSYGLEGAL